MQLSPHFSLAELTVTNTGIPNVVAPEHLANLKLTASLMELVRTALGGLPIHVNSGYRSAAVNKAVGGVPTSAHSQGLAVDFTVKGLTIRQICERLIAAGIRFDQLIDEGTWVHIGFGPRIRNQVLTMRGGKYLPGLR